MKTAAFITMAVAQLVAGHATFQGHVVGGVESADGVRGTSNQNNPILSTAADLASDMMICKGGAEVSSFYKVAGGAKLGLQWHHNKGPNPADSDEPIAASHKGPILVYITPYETKGEDNWVKIYEEGYDATSKKWAVDNFIANKGLITVPIPNLKAGKYMIRSEIIALHEGDRDGATQFYNGCGQLEITGSGTATLSGGVDMRKVYKTNDANVKFGIYGGFTSYSIPGPKLFAGLSTGGSAPAAPAPAAPTKAATSAAAPAPTKVATKTAAAPTTLVTATKTATKDAVPAPAPTGGAAAGTVEKYHQCGGKGYTGATACKSGSTCQKQNDFYSQCL